MKERQQKQQRIYLVYIISVKKNNFLYMTEQSERVYGLPSIPRESMPRWYPLITQSTQENNEIHQVPINIPKQQILKIEQNVIANTSQVKSQYIKKSPEKRYSKSVTKSGVYDIKQVHLKRSTSQSKCQTVGSKIEPVKKLKPTPVKLDPQNQEDLRQIEARQQRIKKYMYVTRDLPNSAFTTYYGKPTWEVYGRANSNPNLLTHNVMPHRGENKPKKSQSYYNALLKGKKLPLTQYVPRMPVEEIKVQVKEKWQQQIHLQLQKPDLINHVRFTAALSRKSNQEKIPSSKVTPMQRKNANKSARKQKKKKADKKQTNIIDDDGLKYLNTRDDLLKILEKKKTNSNKLAWKVTECYPLQLKNEQVLKESIKEWQTTKIAGKKSKKCDTVKQLITFYKESPF